MNTLNYIKRLFNHFPALKYLILFLAVSSGAILSIIFTSKTQVLQFDARSYYSLAKLILGYNFKISSILNHPVFIDLGYPVILSVLMQFLGSNLLYLQIFNYIFWYISIIFVFKSLQFITSANKSFIGALIMSLSPTFLTFSAKLYSEPFASMGTAIIIYFLLKYKINKKYLNIWGMVLGMLILFSTKSVFGLLFIPLFYLLINFKDLMAVFIIFSSSVMFIAVLLFSLLGGRSNYNLGIQVAKLNQSYSTIGACTLFYVSYPVGKSLLPGFEGACRQNDPAKSMPKYNQNPYLIAGNMRSTFSFGLWLKMVVGNPIKYMVIVISSMANLIFIEGIYANITEHFNSFFGLIVFGAIKVFFAGYIWINIYKNFKLFLLTNLKYALFSLLPLIYFIFIVGNYPVEQRYFYPLLPWVYFYAALNKESINKIIYIFSR